MEFRIGINVGDVMVKDGDIFRDGVNIAARLEGLAEPGGICISRGIHDHILNKLPFRFEDLGEKSVKNISQPIRVFRLLPEGRETGGPLGETNPMLPDEAPLPEVEPIPSLLEEVPAAPTSEPQSVEIEFWDLIKNSARADEYVAYLEQYPALTRSGENPAASGIRRIGRLNCRFGSWSARARIPRWLRRTYRNIPMVSSSHAYAPTLGERSVLPLEMQELNIGTFANRLRSACELPARLT